MKINKKLIDCLDKLDYRQKNPKDEIDSEIFEEIKKFEEDKGKYCFLNESAVMGIEFIDKNFESWFLNNFKPGIPRKAPELDPSLKEAKTMKSSFSIEYLLWAIKAFEMFGEQVKIEVADDYPIILSDKYEEIIRITIAPRVDNSE